MTINEYWQLLKDCHIASSGHGDTKSARLDLIFIKSNQRTGLPDTGQLNPDQYVGSVRTPLRAPARPLTLCRTDDLHSQGVYSSPICGGHH